MAETTKTNDLKPYQYLVYILTKLKKYPWNNVTDDVLEKLMPWSPELPDSCCKTETR
ncbi:MAG: transposase domain-containing protein [Muribaculaceae bacterium]|nr:transposase domain-containing protein [Muribaculaceae bacterium]